MHRLSQTLTAAEVAAETAAQVTPSRATVGVPVARLRYLEAVERAAQAEHVACVTERALREIGGIDSQLHVARWRSAYEALHAAVAAHPAGEAVTDARV